MTPDIATHLADYLIQLTIQGSVLGLVVLGIQRLARTKLSPAACHALWFLVLLRLTFPVFPESQMSIFNLVKYGTTPSGAENASGRSVAITSKGPANTPVLADSSPSISLAEKQDSSTVQPSGARPEKFATPYPPPEAPLNTQFSFTDIKRLMLIAILIGSASLLIRILWSSWQVQLNIRRGPPITDISIINLLAGCQKQFRLKHLPEIIETDAVHSPSLIGLYRPKLLFPKGSLNLYSPKDLRFIFMHELAHLLESNHTARFWNIVRAHVAKMEQARAWLHANGQLLEDEI